MLVDTHCHLFDDKLINDVDNIINSAISNNVKCMIVNGCDTKSNDLALDLSKRYPSVYTAVGYHPTEIDEVDINYLEHHINDDKVVAIGEIGLDYYYTKDNNSEQIEKFTKQLDLAVKYKKAVIIHNRCATDDMYHILKDYKGKLNGIIHCFSGSIETANMFINLGFFLGIGGVLTFKNNDNLREVLKSISIQNIVLETDSPYLTPEPYRKYVNEPKYVVEVAKVLANIYGISIQEVEDITTKNALSLFNIDSI